MLKSLLSGLLGKRRPMRHYHETIQGWCCYTPLYARMVETAPAEAPSVFVELGCWKGRSAAFMGVEIINSGKPITFHAIDWFRGSDEPEHRADPEVASLYEVFRRNSRPVSKALGERFVVHREATAAAAGHFADESIDFVMVDAGHAAQDVSADITAWWPKLKAGGAMAGDDWSWPTVQQGVGAAFGGIADRTPIVIENAADYPWWIVGKIERA